MVGFSLGPWGALEPELSCGAVPLEDHKADLLILLSVNHRL